MGVGRERENLSLYISLEKERERSRENTLRARVRACARGERQEAGHETRAERKIRAGRKARDTRHEGGGKIIKKDPENARKKHIKSTVDNY